MTEINGMSQNQEVSQVDGIALKEQNSSNENERVFRQSEVNEIIKKAKYGAVEDFKRLSSQQPNYVQEKHSDSSLKYPDLSEDRLSKMVEEAASKHIERVREDAFYEHQKNMAQKIVQDFRLKTQSGRDKFSDFDTVTGDIEPLMGNFPKVVELLAEHVENADEVYYALGKDLLKMSGLQKLAEDAMPAAIREIKKFSKSLKDNEEAKRIRQPNEPLSQLRPSNTGTDVGAMSVSDYRKKYKG
jgi:hypothetical protein